MFCSWHILFFSFLLLLFSTFLTETESPGPLYSCVIIVNWEHSKMIEKAWIFGHSDVGRWFQSIFFVFNPVSFSSSSSLLFVSFDIIFQNDRSNCEWIFFKCMLKIQSLSMHCLLLTYDDCCSKVIGRPDSNMTIMVRLNTEHDKGALADCSFVLLVSTFTMRSAVKSDKTTSKSIEYKKLLFRRNEKAKLKWGLKSPYQVLADIKPTGFWSQGFSY